MIEFDAEKIMSMSKDEIIDLLGPEKAEIVRQKLASGDLTMQEVANYYDSVFTDYEQASFVINRFFINLSRVEVFNMVEDDKNRQKQFAEMAKLEEEAKTGQVTLKSLRRLLEMAFPDPEPGQKESGQSNSKGQEVPNEVWRSILEQAFIANGKVNEDGSSPEMNEP